VSPDQLLEWFKPLAVIGGVCVGVFAVFSPAWVWLKTQRFSWGALALCLFGTILVVASLFRSGTVMVDAPKIESRLAELEQNVARTQQTVGQTHERVVQLATALERGTGPQSQTVANLETQINVLSQKLQQLDQPQPLASLETQINALSQKLQQLDQSQTLANLERKSTR
jgi:hypothetical protein